MDNIIITCPNCASQYSVERNLLSNGRIMRCCVCSNTWPYHGTYRTKDGENEKPASTNEPTRATAPPADDEQEQPQQPATARRPFIPTLPLEALQPGRDDEKSPGDRARDHRLDWQDTAKPGTESYANAPGRSSTPSSDSNLEVARAKKPGHKPFLSRIFSSSFSWFLLISISANILFWTYYFSNFSVDLKKMF